METSTQANKARTGSIVCDSQVYGIGALSLGGSQALGAVRCEALSHYELRHKLQHCHLEFQAGPSGTGTAKARI